MVQWRLDNHLHFEGHDKASGCSNVVCKLGVRSKINHQKQLMKCYLHFQSVQASIEDGAEGFVKEYLAHLAFKSYMETRCDLAGDVVKLGEL